MHTDIRDVERIIKALANARRLSIIKFLSNRKQASVGQAAEHIKLSFKSTSNHLLIMAAADILERKQTSTTVLYSLRIPVSQLVKSISSIL